MQSRTALFRKVDTVILRVRNLERAQEWYEQKLGLTATLVDKKERLAILNAGGETSVTL